MGSELQKRAIESIDAFNDAVTATRMYPGLAPQVATAVGRAYQSISGFVQEHGPLHLGLDSETLSILGQPLDGAEQEQLRSMAVIKQFALLKLDHLLFDQSLTEDILKKIIFIFTARKEKIAREGGGRAFVVHQDLENNFPSDYSVSTVQPVVDELNLAFSPIRLDGLPSVNKQLVLSFLEKELSEEGAGKLAKTLPEVEQKLSLFLHIIAAIYQSPIEKDTSFIIHPYFTHAIGEFDKIVPEQSAKELAEKSTEELFSRSENTHFLSHLFMQEMAGTYGEQLFFAMLGQLDQNGFKECIDLLRRKEEELVSEGQDGYELEEIKLKLSELLGTDKGKQLLGEQREKAQLDNSEKEEQEKRLKTGMDTISQGDLADLDSDEVVINLPPEIERLLADGQIETVAAILAQLNTRLEAGDPEVIIRLTRTLCLVGEILVKHRQLELLLQVVTPILSWLEASDNGDSVYEKLVEVLQATSNLALKNDKPEASCRILEVFNKIRSGEIKKSGPVKALVGRVQDRSVDPDLFSQLLEDYFRYPETSEKGKLILCHGGNGIKYLMEILIKSEERTEREQLVSLLGSVGESLPDKVLTYYQDSLPWYGKRNLLSLLAEVGNENHVDNVVVFLNDSDLRVQNEAFNTIQKISGSRLKEVLLQVLSEAGYSIKLGVIKVLSAISDDSIARNLIEVLHDIMQGQSEISESDLEGIIVHTSKALSNCHSPEVLNWLKKFLQKARTDERINEHSITAIEQTVLALGMAVDSDELPSQSAPPASEVATEPAAQQRSPAKTIKKQVVTERSAPKPVAGSSVLGQGITFLPEEKKIRELFASGQEEKAVNLLVKLISTTSRQKKFEQADKLRDWLVEASPMSLSQIIQTAEIIEEEKTHAIDRGHLEVWEQLYDALNPDEFSTLYHSMQHRKYGGGEVIIKQHTLLSALFFVNSGKIKLYYSDVADSDVLVKVVGQGEVIGVDSFFNASVWTINAATMGHADVSMLRFDKLQRWKEEYPALESKLNDYCLKFESLRDYFKHNTKDRRLDDRHPLKGRVSSILLDKNGNPTNIGSRGELSDISCGGISFFMRISKKENARVLLGHSIRLHVPAVETAGKVINVDGVIVAVRAHLAMENEFSVHIKFNKKLPKTDIQKMLRASKE